MKRVIGLICVVFGVWLFAQKVGPGEEAVRVAEIDARLQDILTSLQQKSQEKDELLVKIGQQPDDSSLIGELAALDDSIHGLERSFEEIAIGGSNLNVFMPQEESAVYDWRGELIEVTKPLLDSMKQATEKPRAIEKLRSRVAVLEEQRKVIDRAVLHLAELNDASMALEVQERLTDMQAKWKERFEENRREIDLVQYQLNDKLGTNTSIWLSFWSALVNFFRGRGFHFLLAVLVFFMVNIAMNAAFRLYWKRPLGSRGRSHVVRLVFRVVTLMMSLGLALTVLYVLGDWVLLGLAIVLMVGFIFGVKGWIPKFITETKLLLNIGPVREGERLQFDGLPWLVESINFYCYLTNPLLTAGRLRIPLGGLVDLQSRVFSPDEPWFPTREGDWLLWQSHLVRVALQTPERVQIQAIGGAVKSIETRDFLAGSAQNLSNGCFGVSSVFGIDYAHQALDPDQVCREFEMCIRSEVGHRLGDSVKKVSVEFLAASASSLDYLARLEVSSLVADQYDAIERSVQKACVLACNQNRWGIPFQQITVHQAAAE